MKKSTIQKRVINIITTILDYKGSIDSTTHLHRDLGIDSLDDLVISQEIEKVFLINLSQEDVKVIMSGTVEDMVNFIDKFLQGFDSK